MATRVVRVTKENPVIADSDNVSEKENVMSEVTAEVTETEVSEDSAGVMDDSAEVTENADEPKAPAYVFDDEDDFGPKYIEHTNARIARLNVINKEIKEASGDEKAVIEAIIAGDDENVVEARNAANEAKAEADRLAEILNNLAGEMAKAQLSEKRDDDKLAALNTEAEKLAAKIKATKNLLKVEYAPSVLELLTPIEGGTKASAGTGTGPRRLRGFTITVDGKEAKMKNNNNELVSSFSAGAKEIGCDTGVLQDAYYKAVGTDDAEKFPVGETKEFPIEFDGKTYKVTATKNAKA